MSANRNRLMVILPVILAASWVLVPSAFAQKGKPRKEQRPTAGQPAPHETAPPAKPGKPKPGKPEAKPGKPARGAVRNGDDPPTRFVVGDGTRGIEIILVDPTSSATAMAGGLVPVTVKVARESR